MNTLKTPLRYPGGKSRAVDKIYSRFPNGIKEYREPFLGGGSLAIHMSQKHFHTPIWVNDLYEPLYNFWACLQVAGDIMQERLVKLKEDNPYPEKAKELFLSSKDTLSTNGNDVNRAIAFYVVNKCSFSGLSESSSFSAQASDSNFSMRGINKLTSYMKIIKNWRITNLSYEELLVGDDDSFIYLDPPYEIGSNLYGKKGAMHKGFDHDVFFTNCDISQQRCLVSYNTTQVIKNRFLNWTASEFDLTYTMRSVGDYMNDQKHRKELLLSNY